MADFSPTGYWAHYGINADDAPWVQRSLPVIGSEDEVALVFDRRGCVVAAHSIKGFLHVSPHPDR